MDTQESYSGSDTYDASSTASTTDTAEMPVVDAESSRKGRSSSSSRKADTGSDATVQDTVQHVQDTAGQVMDQAHEAAGKVVDQVRGTASSQLSTQKDRAAETVSTVAQVIRTAGDQLKDQNQPAIAQYADKAAQRVDQFSSYLQNKDVREIATEIEHIARRQPTLFLAGAFALGLLGARFLKSSGQQAQQGQQSNSTEYSTGATSAGYSSSMQDASGYGDGGYQAPDMEG